MCRANSLQRFCSAWNMFSSPPGEHVRHCSPKLGSSCVPGTPAPQTALERMRKANEASSSTADASAQNTLSDVRILERTAQEVGDAPSTSYASAATATAQTSSKALGASGQRSKTDRRRGRGLESSMEFEDGLRSFWYPAEFSAVRRVGALLPGLVGLLAAG